MCIYLNPVVKTIINEVVKKQLNRELKEAIKNRDWKKAKDIVKKIDSLDQESIWSDLPIIR